MKKDGILVVSFGTSYEDNREKTIGAIERHIKKVFDPLPVYRAFTSRMILKKMKKQGIEIDSVTEAVERMKADGINGKLTVQPTHIINGVEYDMLMEDLEQFRNDFEEIQCGNPLLTDIEDYMELAGTINAAFKTEDGEALLLMGHGTDHHANSAYPAFCYVLSDMGFDHIFLGTVEGYPEFNDAVNRLKKTGYKKVCLAPMMIVAGDHANNDMVGDEEDSWKSMLEKDGYSVRYLLTGLGELQGVWEIFEKHLKKAMSGSDADDEK